MKILGNFPEGGPRIFHSFYASIHVVWFYLDDVIIRNCFPTPQEDVKMYFTFGLWCYVGLDILCVLGPALFYILNRSLKNGLSLLKRIKRIKGPMDQLSTEFLFKVDLWFICFCHGVHLIDGPVDQLSHNKDAVVQRSDGPNVHWINGPMNERSNRPNDQMNDIWLWSCQV